MAKLEDLAKRFSKKVDKNTKKFHKRVAKLGKKKKQMHPNVKKRMGGRLWHLEDTVKTKLAADALKTHLVSTEDKKSKIVPIKNGYEVWWSK